MNKEQFIFWLKGFARAVNEEGPTPKQWETIVSELDKIKDCPDFGSPIDLSNPFPRWQEPHYVNPWDKYKVTCTTGSAVAYGISTPLPTYNPSTTTQWNPSSSYWSYTNTLSKQPTTVSNQLELDLE